MTDSDNIELVPDDSSTRVREFLTEATSLAAVEVNGTSYLQVMLSSDSVEMIADILEELKKITLYLAMVTDSHIENKDLM